MDSVERKDLSKAEWKVMKIVWELQKAMAREVYTIAGEQHAWAPATRSRSGRFRTVGRVRGGCEGRVMRFDKHTVVPSNPHLAFRGRRMPIHVAATRFYFAIEVRQSDVFAAEMIVK